MMSQTSADTAPLDVTCAFNFIDNSNFNFKTTLSHSETLQIKLNVNCFLLL